MLNQEYSLILMIDIQEKLVSMLGDKGKILREKAIKFIKASKILNIKTIITEQYPKGLLETIPEIKEILDIDYKPFEKTSFSATLENDILNEIKSTGKKQIILFGIEAHICVLQTALSLKEMGYEVFVISDIIGSRSDFEKEAAIKLMNEKGILTLTLEIILFMLLKSSKHPNFKEVQALIK